MIPYGFLHCNGSSISKTTYADLFNVIGYKYKKSSESASGSTFRIPDLREVVLKGVGENEVYPISTHNPISTLDGFQDDAFQSHTHYITVNSKNAKIGDPSWMDFVVPTDSSLLNRQTGNAYNARTDSTTHDKSVGIHYMIKCYL